MKKLYFCIFSGCILFMGCKSSDKEFVYETCIDRVKSRLKAPSTAKFSPKSETIITQHIKKYPNDGVLRANWTVMGYVDSQNSFSAQIRTNFTCDFVQWKQEITIKKVKL